MPKEYQATFPVQADSLEEAHRIVDEWDTGSSHVKMITGPPEAWIEPPEVVQPDEHFGPPVADEENPGNGSTGVSETA